jgi:hypothetical protein
LPFVRPGLHFRGHDRKTTTGFAGPHRLDGGVEREQIGLSGNGIDEFDDVADASRRLRGRRQRGRRRLKFGRSPGDGLADFTDRTFEDVGEPVHYPQSQGFGDAETMSALISGTRVTWGIISALGLAVIAWVFSQKTFAGCDLQIARQRLGAGVDRERYAALPHQPDDPPEADPRTIFEQ